MLYIQLYLLVSAMVLTNITVKRGHVWSAMVFIAALTWPVSAILGYYPRELTFKEKYPEFN